MVVTYREKEWVTAAVFESILAELTTISTSTGRARIVVATGCDDDDVHIRRVYDRFRRESGPFGPHPELTLVTCYPFYFIGAAPKRFIVHARLRWRWCMKYLTDKPLLTAYRQAVRPDFQ